MSNLPSQRQLSSWYSKRTSLERYLCVFLLFLGILCLSLIIVAHYNKTEVHDSVCLSPECVKSAATILRNIDPSVDPCDDFYQFSCGGWIDRQHTPDSGRVTIITIVRDNVSKRLREILEKPVNGSDAPDFEIKVKKMYNSCLRSTSETNDTNYRYQKVLPLLESLGGWPVMLGDSWEEKSFNWLNWTSDFRKNGLEYNIFHYIYVDLDMKNTSRHVLHIYNGFEEVDPEEYLKSMVDTVIGLKGSQNRTKDEIEKEMSKVRDVAVELFKVR